MECHCQFGPEADDTAVSVSVADLPGESRGAGLGRTTMLLIQQIRLLNTILLSQRGEKGETRMQEEKRQRMVSVADEAHCAGQEKLYTAISSSLTTEGQQNCRGEESTTVQHSTASTVQHSTVEHSTVKNRVMAVQKNTYQIPAHYSTAHYIMSQCYVDIGSK